MGWEWRFFVRLASFVESKTATRKDVYFPATDAHGLKLRNNDGHLEFKLRQAVLPIDEAHGSAEQWVKSLHPQAENVVKMPNGQWQLTVRAVETLVLAGSKPLPVRVVCAKDRKMTRYGEEVECIFSAYLDGHPNKPILVECYRSVSIEVDDTAKLADLVRKVELPAGAIVTGYPGLVAGIAQRALALGETKNRTDPKAETALPSSSGAVAAAPPIAVATSEAKSEVGRIHEASAPTPNAEL